MSDRLPVDRIFEEWCERRDRGDVEDPREIFRRYPEHAEELRERFRVLRAVDEIVAETMPVGESRRIGEYRLLRELGRGGMGTIYEAEQLSMHRRVALKVLSPAVTGTEVAVRRFQREARAAGRLHHTNIVPIYGMGEDRGVWFYAMELVRGRPLDRVIEETREERTFERGDPLSSTSGFGTTAGVYARIAEKFAGVADALEAAHAAGIIHRDVKPSNLILDDEGTLKLMDFGLARERASELVMTRTGDIVGTPAYMSPEQASARVLEIDHRTDVYSLGATMYEVLTLERPFGGVSLAEVCSQIRTQDPAGPRRRNRRVPRDLETIVLKAMEKEPAKRYATAASMARDLRAYAAGGPLRARRVTVVGKTWRRVKRHKLVSALTAATLLFAIFGGVLGSRVWREAEREKDARYERLCAETLCELQWGDPGFLARGSSSLDEAVELRPGRHVAWFLRATLSRRPPVDRFRDADRAREAGLSERAYHFLRAMILRDAGRPEESKGEAVLAEASSTEDGESRVVEAQLRIDEGRWEDAVDVLQKVSRDSGGSTLRPALSLRAFAKHRCGDEEGALADWLAAQALGEPLPELDLAIAMAWLRTGNEERAEGRFQSLLERLREDGGEQDWARACTVAGAFPRYGWREALTREGVRRYPDSVSILVSRFGHLLLYGEPLRRGEVGKIAERIARNSADERTRLEVRGHLLSWEGKAEEAIATHEEMYELEPWSKRRCLGALILEAHGAPEALEWADSQLSRYPGEVWALETRARALNRLGRFDEGLESVRQAILRRPSEVRLRQLLGTLLANTGRAREAVTVMQETVADDPTNWESRHDLARALVSAGRFEEALDSFRIAKELGHPPDGDFALDWATLLAARMGRSREAMDLLDACSPRTRASPMFLVVRGEILLSSGEVRVALESARRALEGHPRDAAALFLAVRAASALQLRGEALGFARRLATVSPDSPLALARLAWALADGGEIRDALAVADLGLRRNPDSILLWHLKAELHERRSEPRAALRAAIAGIALEGRVSEENRQEFSLGNGEYTTELDLWDEMVRLHVIRASSLAALGLPPPDGETCPRYLGAARSPDEPFTERDRFLLDYEEAVYLSNLGRFAEALERIESAWGAGAGATADPEVHRLLGYVLKQLGQLDEAVRAYGRILAESPEDESAILDLARCLNDLGRHEAALAAFESVPEPIRESNPARYVRAFALVGLDRDQEAVELANAVLETDPGDCGALQIVGYVHWRRAEYAGAIRCFETMAASGDEGGAQNLVDAIARCPDSELPEASRTIAILERLRRETPGDPVLCHALGKALFRAGRLEDAIAVLEALDRAGVEHFVGRRRLYLAMALQRLDQPDAARDCYRRALQWQREHAAEDDPFEDLRREASELLGLDE